MPDMLHTSLPEDEGDFDVDQRERPTVRIKGLIRQYPRGPGVIKEFIQNADDAKSSRVRVIMDWRDFRSTVSPTDPTRAILGPALLVWNESTFSSDDFKEIQRIGESGKPNRADKTGRFGLGFNACYNITDYPSFISGDRLLCFDPHQDAIAAKGRTGRGYYLTKLRERHPVWLHSFSAAGVDPSERTFAGTVFRLPLRDPERAAVSEISKEAFGEGDFAAIVERLVAEGAAMLLFTRHVLDLSIEEIPAEGGNPRTLLEIRTVNRERVAASRRSVHAQAERPLTELLTLIQVGKTPKSMHYHALSVMTPRDTTEAHWLVNIGFYPDAGGLLLRQARRMAELGERAVPEVGVAIPLARGDSETFSVGTCDGALCCGLPLPFPAGLPVHVNACFDVDDSRTGLTRVTGTGDSSRVRGDWNRLLLCHAVAAAYAEAVEALPLEPREADVAAFYRLWPGEAVASLQPFSATLAIHAALARKAVFRTTAQPGVQWKSFSDVSMLPATSKPEIVEPLVAEGFFLAEPPLPPELLKGASSAGLSVATISPQTLRRRWQLSKHAECRLEEAPFPALRRRDWLEAVVRFLLADKTMDMSGLPVALLADGSLGAFGLTRTGVTFAADIEERAIFADYPHWFIDHAFSQATGLAPQEKAKFRRMEVADVLSRISEVLPKSVDSAAAISWDRGGEQLPNERWLTRLLRFLSTHASGIEQDAIQVFPLIPDQFGRLHPPCFKSTPVLRPANLRLATALEGLSVPIVTGSSELISEVERFSGAFGSVAVSPAEGAYLIYALVSVAAGDPGDDARFKQALHAPVLDALSDNSWLERLNDEPEDTVREDFRSLHIIPMDDGAAVQASRADIFLPTDEEPPATSGRIHLARLGPRGRWRTLFEWAGIRALDLPALIRDVLVPNFSDREHTSQVEILRYIRDHLPRALEQEIGSPETPSLREVLGQAKLILAANGSLRAPRDLYDPALRDELTLLGDAAHFPDLTMLPAPSEAWLDFFKSLGLKTKLSGSDIVARIDFLAANAPSPHATRVLAGLLALLNKRWDDLKDDQVSREDGTLESLADALRRRRWLPADMNAKFPGFQPPERRYYTPSEIYQRALGHLVAGEAPLVAGAPIAGALLSAIGLPTRPPVELVRRRFDRLIALAAQGKLDASTPDELRSTFDEVYRYFGIAVRQREGGAQLGRVLGNAYRSERCIWHHEQRKLLRPRDVFAEAVGFFEPHKVRLRAEGPLAAGLDALGRRHEPDEEDYVDFLQILARHKGSVPCDDREQRQVQRVLAVLASPESRHVLDGEVPLLAESGRLVLPAEMFVMDTLAWEGRFAGSDLEFLHPRIAALLPRGLVQPISQAANEVLEREPAPSRNRDAEAFCERYLRRLRSEEFARSLLRLVCDQSIERVAKLNVVLDSVEVRSAIEIETSLLVDVGSTTRKVGCVRVGFFADEAEDRIWIAAGSSSGARHKMARAINGLLGEHSLTDRAALEAILGCEPERMDAELDERGIRRLIDDAQDSSDWADTSGDWGEDGDDQTQHRSAHADESGTQSSEDGHGIEGADEGGAAEADNPSPARSAPGGEPRGVTARDHRPKAAASRPASTETQPPRSTGGGSGERSTTTGGSTAPPTEPGDGRGTSSSSPAHDVNSGAGDGGGDRSSGIENRKPRGRFVTYVSSEERTGEENDREDAEPTGDELDIGRAAVRRVLDLELSEGRAPREMSHTNPGYDVVSVAGDGIARYIEVKGVDGQWDNAGVRISATQFRFALTHGLSAWLYVVEHARNDQLAVIHRIQDPANRTSDFCFDMGWRHVAGLSASVSSMEPPGKGEPYVTRDGEIVEVVDVIRRGVLIALKVRSVDGQERTVPWAPGAAT